MNLQRFVLPILACAAVAAFLFMRAADEEPAVFDERPNIVLIYLDDLDCETLSYDWESNSNDKVAFPTLKQMVDEGTSFSNFHVTTPVCGPSRACLFSGQYSHRNGIRVNNPAAPGACGFSGGFRIFDRENEVGHWMQDAGYSTAFVGKYLHEGFTPFDTQGENWIDIRPVAWDHFTAFLGANYFGSRWTQFETVARPPKTEYRTDREGDHCIDVVKNHTTQPGRKPLLLLWAPLATHLPQAKGEMVAPRHEDFKVSRTVNQIALYQDEIADGTKHPCIEKRKEIPADRLAFIEKFWAERIKSLRAFDENLAKLKKELADAGELENTILMFTSDHGYSLGAHRHIGKRLPYDRVTKVPFLVSGPGVKQGVTCDALLANIDIAPTLVGLAGGNVPENIDGHSFANLIFAPDSEDHPVRDGVIIENWEIEYQSDCRVAAQYAALRMKNSIYTEWADGRFEYFDLSADPNQKDNLYETLSSERKSELWELLHGARNVAIAPIIADKINVAATAPSKYGMVEFSGFVEDDHGIQKVEVEILDNLNNEYWNGESWQQERVAALAQIGCDRGILSTWSYRFESAVETSSKRRDLFFSVVATDLQGNSTTKSKFHSLELRPDEPFVWLNSPQKKALAAVPFTISGAATDNEEVKEVRLLFHDESNELYFNGSSWQKKMCHLPLTLAAADESKFDNVGIANPFAENTVAFSYEFKGPYRGHIMISVIVEDNEGNVDTQVPQRRLWNTKKNMTPKPEPTSQ